MASVGTYRGIVLLLVAAISGIAAVFHVLAVETLTALCREDGLVESATAVFFLLAGLRFALRSANKGRGRLFALGLSVLCVFVAAEEVSWGQRLLGVETPDVFAEYSVQNEINIHNLTGIHGHVRAAGIAFAFALFIAVPVSVRIGILSKCMFFNLGIPVAQFYHVFIVVAAVLFQALPRLYYGSPVFNLDEMGEFLFSIAFLALAIDSGSWAMRYPVDDFGS